MMQNTAFNCIREQGVGFVDFSKTKYSSLQSLVLESVI